MHSMQSMAVGQTLAFQIMKSYEIITPLRYVAAGSTPFQAAAQWFFARSHAMPTSRWGGLSCQIPAGTQACFN